MPLHRYAFTQVDVFTARPFGGNQLAVFTDARGLNADEMQTLTREMNYSECSFVLPPESPGAAARVRIFTPAREMPMAGHPTVGTAWVLAQAGALDLPENGVREVLLDLQIGPVAVAVTTQAGQVQFVWMQHRLPQFGRVHDDRAQVGAALGLAPDDLHPALPQQVVSTGVPFLVVPLGSLAALARCVADQRALGALFEGDAPLPLYVFAPEAGAPDADVRARMFSPHVFDILEDPATGAAAAPLGAYLAQYGVLGSAPTLQAVVEQGVEMGRPSRITVRVSAAAGRISDVRIGGQAVVVGEGTIFW